MCVVPIKQAAEYLGIKESTLRLMTRRKQVPHIFTNGKYLYDIQLVEQHLMKTMIQNVQGGESSGSDLSTIDRKAR